LETLHSIVNKFNVERKLLHAVQIKIAIFLGLKVVYSLRDCDKHKPKLGVQQVALRSNFKYYERIFKIAP
jgi:hypothetical protein